MERRFSINARLITLVCAILFVVVLAISTIIFYTFKASLDSSLRSEAIVTVNFLQEEIKGWFSPLFGQAEATSYAAASSQGKPQAMLPILKSVMRSNSDISDMYWVGQRPYKDGGYFIDGTDWIPPADYDQSTRDWYRGAQKASGIFLTEPYVDAITRKIVVSIARKVTFADGSPQGVVGIDIFITKIGELVSAKKISPKGKTYLINKDGLFITNEKAEAVLRENIFSGSPLRAVKSEILARETRFGIMGQAGLYYASTPYSGTDWTLVSYGPLSRMRERPDELGTEARALYSMVGAIREAVFSIKTIAQQVSSGAARAGGSGKGFAVIAREERRNKPRGPRTPRLEAAVWAPRMATEETGLQNAETRDCIFFAIFLSYSYI